MSGGRASATPRGGLCLAGGGSAEKLVWREHGVGVEWGSITDRSEG